MSAGELALVRSVRVGLRSLARQARAHRRAFGAVLLLVMVVSAVFIASFGGSGAAAPASQAVAFSAGGVPTHSAASLVPNVPADDCSNGTFSGPCILQQVWNLFQPMFSDILTALGSAFSIILNAFAAGIAEMFTSWGFSLGTYGIWGPLMVIVSLGVAAFVGYYIMDMEGVEADLGKVIGMVSGNEEEESESEEEPEVP